MKLLVLTNLYPPHFVGGYDLQTRDVVDAMRQRGHQVRVLTSTYGIPLASDDGEVRRTLHFRWSPRPPLQDLLCLTPPELQDREALRHEIARYRPDLVLVTNLLGLFRSLPECVSQSGVPLAYDIGDHWLADFGEGTAVFWDHTPTGRGRRLLKAAWQAAFRWRGVPTAPSLPHAENAFFRASALRRRCLDVGMPVDNCPVIHYGVETSRFAVPGRDYGRSPVRLLYAGRLNANKGPHVLLEACSRMQRSGEPFQLTICGQGDSDYVKQLRGSVETNGLGGHVSFVDGTPPEQMPELYATHDVFVFPSIWEEPFGLTRLEAMAAGMPVVTTVTGGGAELVRPDEDCLSVPPDNSQALADVLVRLSREPDVRARLGLAAAATARDRFEAGRAMDRVEAHLRALVAAAHSEGTAAGGSHP